MPGIPYKYLDTFRLLRRATDRLNAVIESGEFYSYGYLKRRKLIRRVRRLYGKLVGPVSPALIGSALAAAGVLALAGCRPADPLPGLTPSFVLRDATDIGLGFTHSFYYGQSFLALADIDGDGDLDLFYSEKYNGDGSYLYITGQLNDGDGSFGARNHDPDGLDGEKNGDPQWTLKPLTFADIDGDADLDLIATGYFYSTNLPIENNSAIFLVENDGDQYAPAFLAPVAFAYGSGVSTGLNTTAASLVDIDGDGDLDLITASYFGSFYLTPNTSQSPASFSAAADSTLQFPYSDSYFEGEQLAGLAIVDLDNDGDKDILMSGYTEWNETENWIGFIENTTTAEGISFGLPQQNPFGLVLPARDGSNSDSRPIASLAAGDIDGDGDIDVLLGTYVYGSPHDTEFFHFENTAIP